jgi:hypothetical protein
MPFCGQGRVAQQRECGAGWASSALLSTGVLEPLRHRLQPNHERIEEGYRWQSNWTSTQTSTSTPSWRIREWCGVSHRVTVLDREQETGAVVLSRRESSQRRDGMIVMHRIFQPSPTGPLDFEATIEWTLLM